MSYNQLLYNQIKKILPDSLVEREEVQHFLSAINETYSEYEKNISFIENAFKVSDEEYNYVYQQLQDELNVKKEAIEKLQEAIGIVANNNFNINNNNLFDISNFIKEIIYKKEKAEEIFTILVSNIQNGILLENDNREILFINDTFCNTFNLKEKAESLNGVHCSIVAMQLQELLIDPIAFFTKTDRILSARAKNRNEIIELKDGRFLERNYTPILLNGNYQGHLWSYIDITESKISETKIKASDERNLQILNGSPDGIIVADQQGLIKFWNKQFLNIFGLSENEIQNKSLIELIIPTEIIEEYTNRINKYLFTEELNIIDKRIELNVTNKLKEELFIELSITKVKGGILNGVFCIYVKDITQQKKIQNRILANELLLARSQQIAHFGSWEFDLINEKIYWTDELYRIYGLLPQSIVITDEVFFKMVHPEDVDIIKKSITDLTNNHKPYQINFRIIRPDGAIRIINEQAEVVLNKENKPIKILGIGHDLTEQKKAEDSIISEKKFREEILNNLPADIAVFDENQNYIFLNEHAIKDKTTRDWLIGRNDFDYCKLKGTSTEMAHKRHDLFKKAINEKTEVEWIDEHIKANGDTIFMLRRLSPYFENNQLKFVSGYALNITNIMHIEQKLKTALEEMEYTNKELEQFAYVASHDLQEPLRMITSFLTQLERKYQHIIDEKGKQYIHFAVDGAKRMRQIILDLLEYSRVGRTEDSIELVNLNVLINEILSLYKNRIEEVGAIISLDEMPTIKTFKTPARQVFQNLISNSLKYIKSDITPHVQISVTETSHNWQFEVSDNGIGIESNYYDKIFGLFQRLHNKDEFAGTGIGLSITKKIIENWGGTIGVHSEINKGTTFYFTIPKIN